MPPTFWARFLSSKRVSVSSWVGSAWLMRVWSWWASAWGVVLVLVWVSGAPARGGRAGSPLLGRRVVVLLGFLIWVMIWRVLGLRRSGLVSMNSAWCLFLAR